MLKVMHCRRFNNNNFVKIVSQTFSTKPAPQEKKDDYYEDQLKEFEKITRITQKSRTKKPQKPPFVKNLLLGIFDTDVLTYPELKNEELKELEEGIQETKNVLQDPEVKDCDKLSKQFLKKLAKGRLLGLQANQLMGGRELIVTEICRFTEAISNIKLKNSVVNNESLGIQTLIKFGNDHLKKKYLEPLINGDIASAFCVVEPLSSNIDVLKRTAVLSPDGKSWILNGEKNLVINGSSADIYIVLAHTNSITKDEVKIQKYTAFVVEREFGGVTTSRQNILNGSFETSNITFEDTQIPAENIIGGEEMGENILSEIYPQHRLSTGPICAVLTKNTINKVTEHVKNISKEPFPLYETEAIRTKMGELTTSLYAMESIIYLTAGLMDNYENQDCELESAIVKVFASEQAFLATSSCLDLVGPEGLVDNHWCTSYHQEALSQMILNDTNDNLKIVIALFGLRYAGQQINELVKKLRNPLYYANFIFKRMWTHRKHADDNPKLNLHLDHYLHPSCINASRHLEYCVLRLQYATETFLSRYGPEIVNKHADLKRLAECMIDIYAMTACIGRASRSYCIGLQHSEYEMALASAFCFAAMERVKTKLLKVIDGPYQTTDENFKFVSERVFNFKGYYPVHPLTRNF